MALDVAPEVREILERFGVSPDAEVQPYAGGHINTSYRVQGGVPNNAAGYLLQRLNPVAFRDSGAVMRNLTRLTTHLERAVAHLGIEPERRVVRLVPTSLGEPFVLGRDGACWRLFPFISRTRTIERVENPSEAREVGAAFGFFHRLASTYDGPPLETTIPDFHATTRELEKFEEVLRRTPPGESATLEPEIELIRAHSPLAVILTNAAPRIRLAHNDAKPANVLLDADTGTGLAVVDLDTVMPGTILHDVGDLIRSASSSATEDERDLGRMGVEPKLFLALASGFLAAGGPGILDAVERELFVAAGLTITYEQALRFLADHLAGDRYYRISRPGQNLDRARAQLRLLDSLVAMRGELERAIRELTRSFG